jgi:hypothetical protein
MPRPTNLNKPIFLSATKSGGETATFNFLDGSVSYFGNPIKKSIYHLLVDNLGIGNVRMSIRSGLDLSSSITGAKTIKAGQSIYINDDIDYLEIYFLTSSTVELVIIVSDTEAEE